MAFSSTDWTINYTAKTVTNNDSGTGNNIPFVLGTYAKVGPVLEFFQWLAAEFANTTQMDDDYAFVSDTPTVFRWVSGWAFGHADDYKYLDGASVESADANDFWSNAYTIGAQEVGTQIYLAQNDIVEAAPWWISGNIDILVKVKAGGTWVQSDDTAGLATDGGIWLYAREFGDSFDHGFADISGGRSPIGINTAPDGSNKSGELYLTPAAVTNFDVGSFVLGGTSGAVGKITKIEAGDIYLNAVRGTYVISETLVEYSDREAQSVLDGSTTNDGSTAFTDVVAGWSDITDTFGTISRDLNNGAGSNNYDAEIDCGGRPMNEVYEWLKYLVRYGSTGATYTVNSDDGQEYRSASEGTYTDVKTAPFGTLAGSTFYGARGIWVTNYSVADFVLIDASGTEQSPPDYQKVIATHADLSGAVSSDGSVTVFVAEISGGNIVKNQYTITSTTATTIVASTTIDINKTPQTGTLRVDDVRYDYTGYNAATFTGVTPDPTGESNSDPFYVPLMDLEAADIVAVTSVQSDNIIYATPFDVRTVVRRYGTKPYTADTTFGASGLSFSPILSDDPQAV